MDIPSERARRKNRSTTNLSHLTLAPLTSKLPIDGTDTTLPTSLFSSHHSVSYLQGKSAPTTPRLLSHSPATSRSRSHHRRTPSAPDTQLPKSKSSSQIAHGSHGSRKSVTGTMTPGRRKDAALGPDDRNDSDWLLRTAAMMSTEARESKGQAWLVSRQSSTSLGGMRDPDEEAFEEELQHERDLASRRGSSVMAEDDFVTPIGSRYQSRSHSRVGTRSRLLTPLDRGDELSDSYFPRHDDETPMSGPDFVNLDERLEALELDASQDDEAAVRRLVRKGQHSTGSWLWPFLSTEDNEQDRSDDEGSIGSITGSRSSITAEGQTTGRSGWSGRHFEGESLRCLFEVIPKVNHEVFHKTQLNKDSDHLVGKVDDLQDLIEDLRKDVVHRGVRPLPRQLENVSKDITNLAKELKKMEDYMKQEKPIWTKIWEKELEDVCQGRDELRLMEDLMVDLRDDLEKASETFTLVEQATKEQMKDNGTGASAGTARQFSKGLNNLGHSVDPTAAKEGVLGEVRALQPNHEDRLEAIERAEKLRQKELEGRKGNPMHREIRDFVAEGKLKKSGGFEEVERARKAKDDQIRREVWERQNGIILDDELEEEEEEEEEEEGGGGGAANAEAEIEASDAAGEGPKGENHEGGADH